MTEHEQLMYRLLGRISESDAPIVFKGALITKLILAESGYNTLDRRTVDIDANWTDTPPSMEHLVGIINRALGELSGQFYAVAVREYAENKSAGISILAQGTDEEIMTMDISIKPVVGSKVYHYGEVAIRGVLANEILADKIAVLSSYKMFRRAKDMVDVYALTHCISVQTTDIFAIIENKRRELGGFEAFINQRGNVEHAYGKLAGIEGKPPFEDVYSYLLDFIQPFARKDDKPRIWDSEMMAWEELV